MRFSTRTLSSSQDQKHEAAALRALCEDTGIGPNLAIGLLNTSKSSRTTNKFLDVVWKEAVETGADKKVNMEILLVLISKERSDVKEWFEIAKSYTNNLLFRETYKELVKDIEEKNPGKKSHDGMFQ
ncbi:hypothetical protein HY991_04965 [Candidatus Micrarchaeota archaeon]|nr:hypothetical protein [Candidatus Micrarchaeota archaeon]